MNVIAPAIAWLQQAEADLKASNVQSPEISECHRRYWIQQAYEKGVKAFAIALLLGNNTGKQEPDVLEIVCDLILRTHEPLKKWPLDEVSMYELDQDLPKQYKKKNWQGAQKVIRLLTRQIQADFVLAPEMQRILHHFKKIENLPTSSSARKVSLRYPFFDKSDHNKPTAPANCSKEMWDKHQGLWDDTQQAISCLLNFIKPTVGRSRRRLP